MKLRKQAILGTRFGAASTVIQTICRLLQLFIFARFLSPEDFGLMAIVVIIIGIITTFNDLGISAALIHRQDATRDELSSLYWLNIFTGAIAALLILLISPLVVLLFKQSALLIILQKIAIIFFISSFGLQFQMLLQKEFLFHILAAIEIVAILISSCVAIFLATSGFGVWAMVWGFIVNLAIKTLLLVIDGWNRHRPKLHFDKKDLKGYLSFGLYQMGERSINYITARMDQLIVGGLLGVKALGYYNFAFNITQQPLDRFNPIVTKVAFPVFSRIQNEKEMLGNTYFRVVKLLGTINAPILIGLTVLAPFVIPVVFGEKWNSSILLIQILSIVGLLKTMVNPSGSLLLSKGRADLGFKWNIMVSLAIIPAIYTGGMLARGAGIASTLLVFQLLLFLPGYFYLIRPIIGDCLKQYLWTVSHPILLSTYMVLVSMPVYFIIYNRLNPIIVIIITICTAILSYAWLLRRFDNQTFKDLKLFVFPIKDN